MLLVDDQPAVRLATRRLLQRSGYRIVTAADGEEALRAVAQTEAPIDVVLLDATMPGMSGPEVLRALHQLHPALPVVLMSGYSVRDFDDAEVSQAAAFLEKPFDEEMLIDTIRGVLARAQSH